MNEMLKMLSFTPRILILLVVCLTVMEGVAQESPWSHVRRVPEVFEPLPFGAVKPEGWLKDQIQHNVDGFTGHLDKLAPDLVVEDDIYDTERLSRDVKRKELGALGEPGDWQVQFLWWNSETQGNWWDGYIRSAALVGDDTHLKRIEDYVNLILSTQDDDGYLGIYDRELRYKFDNENGELWAKATLLRGLLAWYHYRRDTVVLRAIRRAVDNTMENYPINNSHPFHSVNPNVGGLSHGLMFIDVLEQLHRITGNEAYIDYAVFLYKDFSEHPLNEDAQLQKLMDTSVALMGHGVHTYEHVRAVAAAWQASGNPQLKRALTNFLRKIDGMLTPSGAPVGDEWIGGRGADATSRGYEYCSLHELLHSWAELFIKTGDFQFGDHIEKLFFNAAQGARHPEASCIAYLKSDNSLFMTGGLNGDSTAEHQTRYKYSPVHQDAAVCCVPNAGRIAPYFVEHMWMRKGKNIIAALLGPSSVELDVDDKVVSIRERTAYPFENKVSFDVESDGSNFSLWIRKPLWASRFSVSEPFREENGFIVIQRTDWPSRHTVTVEFNPEVVERRDVNDELYFTYGALVLAHPIASREFKTKTFPLPGYYDLKYVPEGLTVFKYDGRIPIKEKTGLTFGMRVRNPHTGRRESIQLVPIGQTILRQVTFNKEKK